MVLKPMFDRIVAKKIASNNQTQSGIVLHASEDDFDVVRAQILAVGKGSFEDGIFVPMVFEVGDKIVFEKHCCVEFELDGEVLVILKQTDILAKEEEEE